MATPRLSDELAMQAADLYRRVGVDEAARLLGIPRATFDSRVSVAIERGMVKRGDTPSIRGRATKGISKDEPIELRAAYERLRKLEASLRDAERRNRELQAIVDADDDTRSALFRLPNLPANPPKWVVKPEPSGKAVSCTPLLLFSDAQWGEVINAREMDGINAYNSKIASQRYRRLIESSIELCRDHMGARHQYTGFVYARLGDLTSGEIHEDLAETNDLHSIECVKDLVDHELWGIGQLADAFGKVHVVSVPGNHGRTTRKPRSKRFVDTNYDTLTAWMLESHMRNDKRVTFQTPASGDAIVQIAGWTWLFTHGDRIGSRGGEGFIGPVATMARGHKRLIHYYATLGQRIDFTAIGHFHTRVEMDTLFCNGCLPGVSEYAKSGRMVPAEPSQWLLICHPEKGVTARWPVLVGERPRLSINRN